MLSRGISSTQVPQQLQAMVDALVHESNETDDRCALEPRSLLESYTC